MSSFSLVCKDCGGTLAPQEFTGVDNKKHLDFFCQSCGKAKDMSKKKAEMKRKLKVGEHYWWMRHEQFPMDIIKVEEIVAGGKELVIYGLILECDKLRVYRRKDISEETILKPRALKE